MLLIVGLGNVGRNYENTRHNVGFNILDIIAREFNKEFIYKKKLECNILHSNNILLCKPETYMNLSGKSVLSTLTYFKININSVIVFHDDIDVENMKVKIKKGGSDGGHNGLRSISQLCGNDYYRLRIGVGRAENTKISVADYVLSKFTPIELQKINNIGNNIYKNLSLLIEGVMNKNNNFNEFLSKININNK